MGPYIRHSRQISEIRLEDLLPTILHMMDIPISDNADGKVKTELFILNSTPAKREPKYYKAEITTIETHRMTKVEEEEVKDRL